MMMMRRICRYTDGQCEGACGNPPSKQTPYTENKRFLRISVLDREIASKTEAGGATIKALLAAVKDKLGEEISRATLYRDIKHLAECWNAPIEKKQGHYLYADPTFRVPAALVKQDVSPGIYMLGSILSIFKGFPFYEQIKDAYDAMSTILPRDRAEEKQKTILLRELVCFEVNSISPDMCVTLLTAIVQNYTVGFSYAATPDKGYIVQPHKLMYSNSDWWLCASDYRKNCFRYRLSGIQKLRIEPNHATLPLPKEEAWNMAKIV